MRAWEIAKLLIIIQATIGFCNGIGLFEQSYYTTQTDEYSTYEIGNLEDFNRSTGQTGILNQFDSMVGLVAGGFMIIWKIIEAIVFIYPTLVNIFGVDASLAALGQCAIYLEVAIGVAQWWSGRYVDSMGG